MYVLCWTKKDEDGWDFIKTKEDLKIKIKSLVKEGFNEDDMLLFN